MFQAKTPGMWRVFVRDVLVLLDLPEIDDLKRALTKVEGQR